MSYLAIPTISLSLNPITVLGGNANLLLLGGTLVHSSTLSYPQTLAFATNAADGGPYYIVNPPQLPALPGYYGDRDLSADTGGVSSVISRVSSAIPDCPNVNVEVTPPQHNPPTAVARDSASATSFIAKESQPPQSPQNPPPESMELSCREDEKLAAEVLLSLAPGNNNPEVPVEVVSFENNGNLSNLNNPYESSQVREVERVPSGSLEEAEPLDLSRKRKKTESPFNGESLNAPNSFFQSVPPHKKRAAFDKWSEEKADPKQVLAIKYKHLKDAPHGR